MVNKDNHTDYILSTLPKFLVGFLRAVIPFDLTRQTVALGCMGGEVLKGSTATPFSGSPPGAPCWD